ncbi:MAG: hypothetical protein KDC84_10780 [Crocinitomicaceae bacterium]|nr:hypothetical protein [Crocinitomicaceae bacterium]
MKTSIFLLILLSIIGCSSEDLVLDFSNLEIPKSRINFEEPLDSSIASIESQYEIVKRWGYYMETDKKMYTVGEQVRLTLYNKASEEAVEEFLYPSKEESERLMLSFSMYNQEEELIQGIKEKLVSTEPAILGDIFISNENFYILTFTGLPNNMAKKIGVEAYEKSILPGQQLTFNIIPPQKPGFYVIYIFRHDHSGNGVGVWGLNKSVMSNVFEIRS